PSFRTLLLSSFPSPPPPPPPLYTLSLHDALPICHLRDDRQIVRDVDGGGVELLDDVADRCKHLDLRGDVQRRRRLVEDDQVRPRSEEHTSELQSRFDLVCRLLLEKKKNTTRTTMT